MSSSFTHPSVFSFSREVSPGKIVSGSDIASVLIHLIEDLQQWAVRNNYLVGHIKAFVEKDGQTLRISATKGTPDIHQSSGWESIEFNFFTLNMTAIIFGPDAKKLSDATITRFDRWMSPLGGYYENEIIRGTSGNIAPQAAKNMEIKRHVLQSRLKKYNIKKDDLGNKERKGKS